MRGIRLMAAVGLLALSGVLPAVADSSPRSWSGCYAGLHGGGLWGSVDHKATGFPVDPSYQRDVTLRGSVVGSHAGCSYQTDPLVLGIEGDLNWTSVDDSVEAFSNDDTGTRQLWRDRLDWFATLRGRIGYASGPWHAFATAGFAFSNMKLGFEAYRFGTREAKFVEESARGWVAGGGLEYIFQPQWIARIEYLYHRFDGRQLFIDGGNTFFRADEPHFHVVRFGITRRFGM